MNDLQKRVHEYEIQGVAATVQMQVAARRVAAENAGLRGLLALHGVSGEEVEAHLRCSDGMRTLESDEFKMSSAITVSSLLPFEDTQSRHAGAYRTDAGLQCGIRHRPIAISGNLEDASLTAVTTIEPVETPIYTSTEKSAAWSNQRGSNVIVDAKTEKNISPRQEVPRRCSNSIATVDVYPGSSGQQISCEAAANIISQMRGDRDPQIIRASLGCNGSEDCSVKNTTVFQVMDEH